MRFMHLLSQVPAAEHPPHQEPVHGVPGAFLVHDVLSEDECARLMDLTEQVGFCSGESLVEVPRSLRGNDVAVVVVDACTATTLARRLEAFLPTEGHGGAPVQGRRLAGAAECSRRSRRGGTAGRIIHR